MKSGPKKFSAVPISAPHGGTFPAAQKSSRHKSRRIGVTVARLENHAFPQRICSKRILGNTKSITVVTGALYSAFSNLYGALFDEGVCADIRNPIGIGSNAFCFS